MNSSFRVVWLKIFADAEEMLATFNRRGHTELMDPVELDAVDTLQKFIDDSRELAFSFREESKRS